MGRGFAVLGIIAVLVGLVARPATSNSSPVYPPDPNPAFIASPPPNTLLGLWARGRKCARKSWRLRITRHTMQFADERPLQYWYVKNFLSQPEPFLDIEEDPEHHGLDYDPSAQMIADKGAAFGPDEVYYRCSDQFLRNVKKHERQAP